MSAGESLYKTLRIQSIKEEVEGFKTFVFEGGHGIHYEPGQYLTLVRFEQGEELRRSYSITSTPLLQEPISIGVKRVENGVFSRKLVDNAKPGDEWLTTGSGGFFVLPHDLQSYKKLVFFAAGSGITPVYSLLKTALHSDPHLTVVLVYSNASPEKTILLSQLQNLQQQFANRFQLDFLFSNSANLSKARLNRDLLLSYLDSFEEKDQVLFYICGPESYMRLCVFTLRMEGVPAEQIRKENFYFRDVAKRDSSPPDKHDYYATIQMNAKAYRFKVPYPQSILQAAKKAGISLPYSCEAGRCGNCVARCTKGSVWHSYNEVLTDKELSQGLVLTCVGHPIGRDIQLEI